MRSSSTVQHVSPQVLSLIFCYVSNGENVHMSRVVSKDLTEERGGKNRQAGTVTFELSASSRNSTIFSHNLDNSDIFLITMQTEGL